MMRAIVLAKDVTVSSVSMSYYHHGLGPKTHLTLITAWRRSYVRGWP